jgi:Flp pilus assembly protein TadG
MGFFKRLRTLIRNESGNTLAIGAAAMPIIIGGAGLAVDTVQISLAKRELQRAADSAALAGAYAINQNPSSTGTARTTFASNGVTRDLQINNDETLASAAVVENAPTVGAFAGDANAVRVRLTTNKTLSFFSFFNTGPAVINVEATGAIVRDGGFCMLSLEDGNAPGITVGGNATLNLGCGISTNSRSATAITAEGSSTVRASPVMAVGGVPTSANFNGATLIPYSAVQLDPYASLPNPAPTGCRAPPEIGPNDTVSIGPGTAGWNVAEGSICLTGLDVKGNLDFPSGAIVYIDGGELSFGAQAHVTGTGVTFVLTSTNATSNPNSVASVAELDLNGGADIDITAPTTGPYAGVAFYEDRRAPVGRTIRFNGNSGNTINGAMYFPNSYFEYNGNAQTTATCFQLIARRLDFRGNGTIQNSCSGGGNTNNFQGTYVRLVG